MRRDQIGHAVEAKIVPGRSARIHRRAKALLIMAPIDPAGSQPVLVGWSMVVEQAFGGMKNFRLGDAKAFELGNHVVEISVARLVGANILCGIDRIERNLQAPVAGSEAGVIDVRQDDELVVFLEIGQRFDGIGKRRPIFH